jgi:hypothetical protein
VIDANAIAARPAQEAIDGHAPELAGDVPQGHVDGGQRVHHERAAADVAMGAVDFLPDVLDARRVLAVDQIEQDFDERLGDARIDALDLAPAGDAVVGLDLDEDGRLHARGLEAGDANGGRAIADLGGGILVGGDHFVEDRRARGERAGGGQGFTAGVHGEGLSCGEAGSGEVILR